MDREEISDPNGSVRGDAFGVSAAAGVRSDSRGALPVTQSELVTDSLRRSTDDSAMEIVVGNDFDVGSSVGRYRLERRLGRGGMGEVWKALDPHLGREVAIKLVRSEYYLTSELRDSFLREGQRLAALSHPSILEVHDVGIADGRPFLVTEFAEGGTLADAIDAGGLAPERIVTTLVAVARAAHFAHLRGIVHRDIKPSNVLFRGDGEAVLGDFGLAISEEEQLQERPATMGTLVFMSPEQMRGASHAVDGRADVYAIGITLYLCLTGRFPFLARTPSEYRRAALEREPRPLRAVDDSIDRELERICLRCIAREPADRYTTALDLANDLEAWLKAKRSLSGTRTRAVAGAAATILAVACVGVAVAIYFGSGASADANRTRAASAEATPLQVFAGELQLLTPSEESISAFRMEDNGDVKLSSDGTALLRLGELPGGAERLSVELVRATPQGDGGIFWGWRFEERDGILEIRWNSCGIRTVGERIQQLYVAEHAVPADRPDTYPAGTTFRVLRFEENISATTYIDVREMGGKARITVKNGARTLTYFPDTEIGRLAPARPAGAYGLCARKSHVAFRNLIAE